MRKTAKFLIALTLAFLLMLVFRAIAFTLCTIDGDGLAPLFTRGDRVLVNRWSYGLRIGGDDSFIAYSRIGRRQPERGDIVAFNSPKDSGQILICRCTGLPGDTIVADGAPIVVPGTVTCTARDHFWMESLSPGNTVDSHSLGLISEELIIGRVTTIVYSHDPTQPLWRGWRGDRTLISIP